LSAAQGSHARQFNAFHPLKEGSASGGNIGEIICGACLVKSGNRVATACHGDEFALLAARSNDAGSFCRATVERWYFEGAERPVPDDGLGRLKTFAEIRNRFGADIKD